MTGTFALKAVRTRSVFTRIAPMLNVKLSMKQTC